MQDKDAQVVSTRELAEDAVRRVRDSGHAVMVVEDGEPAAVLVTAADFALLLEQRRFLSAIDEGQADVEAGRVITTDELKQSLEVEFGPLSQDAESGVAAFFGTWPGEESDEELLQAVEALG